MNINKNLCEKLYSEVKNKLQEEFRLRGMTYKASETSIWKLENPQLGKTYFQQILEETTKVSFSTTFNNMYLWRKRNEIQTGESTNFREDYLDIFIKFLGYSNPQAYIGEFSLTLHRFFDIQKEGKVIVIQPIFDAYKQTSMRDIIGKFALANDQTHDSRDTECILELFHLFQDYQQALPKRIYDQDIVIPDDDIYKLNETVLKQNKANCIFSIGLYSNYFTLWALTNHAHEYIDYSTKHLGFRVKYYNKQLQQTCWTDYYEMNDEFDTGFLIKLPITFSQETINCYLFCGIGNKATQAITSYLCQNWKTIQQKQDYDQESLVNDSPFIMVFRVHKSNLSQIYCEKVVKLTC